MARLKPSFLYCPSNKGQVINGAFDTEDEDLILARMTHVNCYHFIFLELGLIAGYLVSKVHTLVRVENATKGPLLSSNKRSSPSQGRRSN